MGSSLKWIAKALEDRGVKSVRCDLVSSVGIIDAMKEIEFLGQLKFALEEDFSVYLSGQNKEEGVSKFESSGFAEQRILIDTSGSSGKPRTCIHNAATIERALKSYFASFNDLGKLSIVSLPLYHVGGLMAVLRALYCKIDFQFLNYQNLTAKGRFEYNDFIISLVPTQLARLIQSDAGLVSLRSSHRIFVGGAACSAQLIDDVLKNKLPVVFTYGMTETAAMVATSKPHENTCTSGQLKYEPMQGISIRKKEGALFVEGENLFCGFLGEEGKINSIQTKDEVSIHSHGEFSILGRLDGVINSGGKKIFPEQVEVKIKNYDPKLDFTLFGIFDEEWGEIVCMGIVSKEERIDAELNQFFRDHLSPWERPKRIYYLDEIPRSELGKVRRAELCDMLDEIPFASL